MSVAAASAASQAAPGVLGFLVVAGMGLILFFLFRSMTKHLRKVAVDPRQDAVAASSAPASSAPASSAPASSAPASSTRGNGIAHGRVTTGGSASDDLANSGTGDPGADS